MLIEMKKLVKEKLVATNFKYIVNSFGLKIGLN